MTGAKGSPGRGVRTGLSNEATLLTPLRGYPLRLTNTHGLLRCAMGYILPPLRGWQKVSDTQHHAAVLTH